MRADARVEAPKPLSVAPGGVRVLGLAGLLAFGVASTAFAQPSVGTRSIPPGQERLVGSMLDVGDTSGCAFEGAQIESTSIVGRYRCDETATEASLTLGTREDRPSTRFFSLRLTPRHERLERALLVSVRRGEGELRFVEVESEQEPPDTRRRPPAPSVAGALATLAFGLVWLLLALAPRRRGAQLGALLLVGVVATMLARHAFDDVAFGLAWLALVPLAGAVGLPFVTRTRAGSAGRRALIVALALLALALVSRMLIAPTRVANWYVDLHGPAVATVETFTRRSGGYAGSFRMLDAVFPIRGSSIFFLHQLASALSVPVLALTAWRVPKEVGWPRAAAWIFAAALVLDPTLAAVGASDAPHSVGFLAAAVAAFAYVEASRSTEPSRGWLLASALAASLAGLTRPDLAFAPLLGFAFMPPRRRMLVPAAALLVGVGVAVATWAGRDLGVAVRALDAEHVLAWAASVASPLAGAMPARGLRVGLEMPSAILGAASCALLLCAALWRKPRLLAPFAIIIVSALPRVFTDFHREEIGTHIAASRYVLPTLVLWLWVASAGVAALALGGSRTLARGDLKPGLALVAFAAALATATLYPVVRAQPGGAEVSYQREMRVLRAAYSQLPPSSVISLHFVEHFPSRRVDPDLTLGLPHPILAFDRPDIDTRILETGQMPPRCERCYYFRGSLCGVAPEGVTEWTDAADGEAARALVESCDRATSHVSRWVARAPAAAHFAYRTRDDAWIGLGLLGPERSDSVEGQDEAR